VSIVESYSSRNWVQRWFHHGLHSFDLPWLYNYRPLWDVVVVTLLLAGTALCATSLLLAYRVLARTALLLVPQVLGRRTGPPDASSPDVRQARR
jgi:hypothetical protein